VKHTKIVEDIMKAHPLDTALFGKMGAVTAELCADVSRDFVGKQFEFMEITEFETITSASVQNRIYWREILFRVYWAAALNLMRHQRWQAGCIRAFTAPANFLSFAASLRGLVEASLDAFYSLSPAPRLLAEKQIEIELALKGSMENALVCSKELEDRLIHFVYGRKLGKADRVVIPTSHVALEPKEYRNAAGFPDAEREKFRELYDDLCGICHPTAFSLAFFWGTAQGNAGIVRLGGADDETEIRSLCKKYGETINFAISLSVNLSAMCLKVLNRFSLPEVNSVRIDRWNFEDVPLGGKIQAFLSSGTVH
jgi:hypothetical protein